MDRRTFLRAAGLGAVAMTAGQLQAKTKAKRTPTRKPNIIFILADDLGYGHLGCFGQKQIKTPRIDQLAAEGMRFSSFYSGSPVCAPSRCALITGYQTGHCTIRGNMSISGQRVPLADSDITVAEVLKRAGYATGMFGKWGLGEPDTSGIPTRQGFDEWFGYLNQSHAHNFYPDYLWDNEKKVNIKPGTYSHNLFTEHAIDFIKRHQHEPFFLYLPYTIPHAQLDPPSDAPYTDKTWPQPEKNLAAMISLLDSDVGKLADLVDQLGLGNDTLIIFTSDNGPHSEGGADASFFDGSGPLRGIKRAVYEGGIRVPMVARWTGRIKAKSVSDKPWAFWDILPTFADLAGVPSPRGIDGISETALLFSKPAPSHPPFYWEFHEGGFSQAVRKGKWKGVRHNVSDPLELYNLDDDIGEKHDVAKDHPDVVRELESVMNQSRTDNSNWPIPSSSKEQAS